MAFDRPPPFQTLVLGRLPHALVSAALGMAVPDGVVHFTRAAQFHSYKRHGADFLICHAYVAQVVAQPNFIGQKPDHAHDGFEMILEIPTDGLNILAALALRPCNRGIYQVRSLYRIDAATIARRIRKNYLKRV